MQKGKFKMKSGEKKLMRFMGKMVPVRIIAVQDFGVECQFLADSPPVRSGDLTIAESATLFPWKDFEFCDPNRERKKIKK